MCGSILKKNCAPTLVFFEKHRIPQICNTRRVVLRTKSFKEYYSSYYDSHHLDTTKEEQKFNGPKTRRFSKRGAILILPRDAKKVESCFSKEDDDDFDAFATTTRKRRRGERRKILRGDVHERDAQKTTEMERRICEHSAVLRGVSFGVALGGFVRRKCAE